MKALKELRNLTVAELQHEVEEMKRLAFSYRVMKVNGVFDKLHLIKLLRKNIARAKTIITEKDEKQS